MMSREKILIIEDEENTRKLMCFVLEKEGYTTLEARNGISALDILGDHKPDLIILDIILPDIEGRAILNEIRKNIKLKDVPLIFCSGQTEARIAFEAGQEQEKPEEFLAKPFKAEELLSVVNKVLYGNK